MLNKKPKSVHITNYYHKNSGGVSTNYNKLLDAAERHQRFVRLIVPGETEAVEDVNEYAKIYYVAAPQSPIFDKRYRLMMPWQYVQTGTPIRKILLEEMPDLIEIYDNYSLTLLAGIIRKGSFKKLNRPMLVYFTGERLDTIISSFVSKGRFGRWLSHSLMGKYNLPMFDFYIANSPFVAEELFEAVAKNENPHRSDYFFDKCWKFFKAARIPFAERVRVCPRGVDTEKFNPRRSSDNVKREMRERFGIPENSIVVLSSTRISPEKNIRLLPQIMEVLAKDKTRDFRLLVAGAGPLDEWLQTETAAKFPGKIVQTGHLDKETLADYYANADVFLHPNPREPFGNVALEAMASGAPTLVPNSGGVLTYANDENAWLAEANGENFAAAISQIIENKGVRQQKIKNALKTANANNNQKAIDSLFTIYDEMLDDFRQRNELFAYRETSKEDKFNESIFPKYPTHQH